MLDFSCWKDGVGVGYAYLTFLSGRAPELGSVAAQGVGRTATIDEEVLHAVLGVASLYQHLRLLAGIDAAHGARATEIAIEHMYLAVAHHGHTLLAAFVPEAIGEGDVQVERVLHLPVGGADEVGIAVIVGALRIAKTAPGDGDKVALLGDVEVAIHAIDEFAMIHPKVGGAYAGDEVGTAHIQCAGANETKVAENDVLAAANGKNAALAVRFQTIVVVLIEHLADGVFALLAHGHSVGQCAAPTVGREVVHVSRIEETVDGVGDVESGADGGAIQANDGFAAEVREQNGMRHHKRAADAIEKHHVVLLHRLPERF